MNWNAFDFAPGDFARGRLGPPSQTGEMSIKKLTELIKAGYGQGHFQRYKPWLRVTKRDYSPNSNVGHLPAPTVGRAHHYRSRAERDTILLVKWLGAIDVRDAYPVWPWGHPHPGDGLGGFTNSPYQPGLLTVAKAAGIDHGRFPGTKLPYVATIDIMSTWRRVDGTLELIAFENKPEAIAYAPDPLLRPKERLELTQRYCASAQIKRILVHAEKFPRELIVNLDLIEPTWPLTAQEASRNSSAYRRLIDLLSIHGYTKSPFELIVSQASDTGIPISLLWTWFYLALWYQDVDHDIRAPLKTWMPLIPGGRKFQHQIRKDWVGGTNGQPI
nr:hypothetical protein [uncultured Albidiferax sp.]